MEKCYDWIIIEEDEIAKSFGHRKLKASKIEVFDEEKNNPKAYINSEEGQKYAQASKRFLDNFTFKDKAKNYEDFLEAVKNIK